MPLADLTNRQKEILRTLVRLDEADCFPQQGIAMFTRYEDAYHLFGGKLDLSSLADLDELCAEGLLEVEQKMPNDARYRITNLGRKAIAANFSLPVVSPAPPVSIGTIYGPVGNIGSSQGSTFQVVNQAQDSKNEQIINDPVLLQQRVDELAASLLNAVKTDLLEAQFNQYAAAVDELKQQILQQEKPSLNQRVLRTLALLGDVEGTLGLMSRVWPLVQPLLALAAMKLM